jgi:HAD superfamily hydrolase (TIGR01509 family)
MIDQRPVGALLLDLDGTLVDSDAAVARAWRRWAGWHGLEPVAILAGSAGRPATTVVKRAAPHLDDDDVKREGRALLALQYEDLEDVVAAEGSAALLETLEVLRLPWAVVTSADRRLARARLRTAGISASQLITVEDGREGKPAPEGYLLASARLGVEPGHCLVVEDSAAGIEAGRRAGMRVAGLRGAGGDLAVRDLRALARLLMETSDRST